MEMVPSGQETAGNLTNQMVFPLKYFCCLFSRFLYQTNLSHFVSNRLIAALKTGSITYTVPKIIWISAMKPTLALLNQKQWYTGFWSRSKGECRIYSVVSAPAVTVFMRRFWVCSAQCTRPCTTITFIGFKKILIFDFFKVSFWKMWSVGRGLGNDELSCKGFFFEGFATEFLPHRKHKQFLSIHCEFTFVHEMRELRNTCTYIYVGRIGSLR